MTLMQLTDREIERLNVLYLAPYAPEKGAVEPPPMHPEVGVAPRYNYELYTILRQLGLRVDPYRDLCGNLSRFTAVLRRYNFVFTIYNRAPFRNSEIFVSSVCEYMGIPYLGAPPNIRALAEDKWLTRRLAQTLDIPVSPGAVYDAADDARQPPDFDGPYIVKPRFGAASQDITAASVGETWTAVMPQLRRLLNSGEEAVAERCVTGTDVTVPVLGGDPPLVLPPAEEISGLPHGIATFRQKRLIDKGRRRIILSDEEISRRAVEYARRLAAEVEPFDYLRVDFRLDAKRGMLYLLEFNLGCNLGSHAAIALSAANAGYAHASVIHHIIAHSIRRRPPSPGRSAVAGHIGQAIGQAIG